MSAMNSTHEWKTSFEGAFLLCMQGCDKRVLDPLTNSCAGLCVYVNILHIVWWGFSQQNSLMLQPA